MRAVERFDNFAGLRYALKEIATEREQWAGIPMPLDNERLVIEPTYPNAKALMAFGPKPKRSPLCMNENLETRQDGGCLECGADQGEQCRNPAKIRNTFWSVSRRSTITIFEKDGKIDWGLTPGIHHLGHDLSTLGCSEAWGIEQEHNALQLLGTLIRHHPFKQYLLTGMFLETSKRSGVTYLFRKLRPTVAIRLKEPEGPRILCTLCLHPIAYYAGSWAGVMCPTDDVISHLMLMRGDEPMFWRRANQHPPWAPEAGL